jgi:nucleotide-binding universal stress UspA family protein
LLAGVRRIPTTVVHFDPATPDEDAAAERTEATVKAGADEATTTATDKVDITTRTQKTNTLEAAIAAEAKKGYGLLVIGREPALTADGFDPQMTRSVAAFGGPFAIAIARPSGADAPEPLNILVPISGTSTSREGAELAIALAQASQGSVTALYVTNPSRRWRNWRQQFGTALAPENSADAAIREIVEMGGLYNIEVRGVIRSDRATEKVILKEIESGRHSLLVMGVSPRPGRQLFLGDVAAEVLPRAKCSILLVSGEHRQAPTPANQTSQ